MAPYIFPPVLLYFLMKQEVWMLHIERSVLLRKGLHHSVICYFPLLVKIGCMLASCNTNSFTYFFSRRERFLNA